MGNYKDMVGVVENLIKREKPFLLIKYCNKWLGRVNNAYEIVTIFRGKLRYLPIDRAQAMESVKKFDLPLLYQMDNRNAIWGDIKFKQKYNELCVKEIISIG